MFSVIVAGATGLVGKKMLKVLEEREFPISKLKLLASQRSLGKSASFKGIDYPVEVMTENSFDEYDIALFSAGGAASLEFAPHAAKAGCLVIDNSSAWRMDSNVPLVVPEVNPQAAFEHKGIIANPNCSTIQLAVALKPIADKYGLKRVVISTYQSISGAGQKGLDKLYSEIKGDFTTEGGRPIAYNAIFHPIEDNDFTNEENKMINETRKIMGMPELKVTATCVRLPILGGHAESINIETEKSCTVEEISSCLQEFKSIVLMNDNRENIYPTPRLANEKDDVFIGRIRKDESVDNGFHLWIVADNVRKGAATNAVQIAELFKGQNI